MNERAERVLESGHWHRTLWQLSWPLILANISIPLVGMVDTAVVGHLPDSRYIGAVSVGAVIFGFVYWGFGFLRMSTTGFVAQCVGSDDADELSATMARAFVAAILIGFVLLVLQGVCQSAALWSVQASDEVESLAALYFSVRIWGAPAVMVNYVVVGLLFGAQRTGLALLTLLVLNLSNVVLDLFFVYVLGMHVDGVAIATVISEYLSAAIGVFVALRVVRQFGGRLHGFSWLDRKALLGFFSANFNIMVRSLCLLLSFFAFTAMSARLGDDVLAANAVLQHFLHLAAYGLDGFAHAVEALAGHAYGRRARASFRAVTRVAFMWAGATAMLFCLFYLLAGDSLIRLMTDIASVQSLAHEYLWWAIFMPLVAVWSFMLDGIFSGTTRTAQMRNAMLITLVGYLAVQQVLMHWFGNHGLWAALVVLYLLRALTLMVYMPAISRDLR